MEEVDLASLKGLIDILELKVNRLDSMVKVNISDSPESIKNEFENKLSKVKEENDNLRIELQSTNEKLNNFMEKIESQINNDYKNQIQSQADSKAASDEANKEYYHKNEANMELIRKESEDLFHTISERCDSIEKRLPQQTLFNEDENNQIVELRLEVEKLKIELTKSKSNSERITSEVKTLNQTQSEQWSQIEDVINSLKELKEYNQKREPMFTNMDKSLAALSEQSQKTAAFARTTTETIDKIENDISKLSVEVDKIKGENTVLSGKIEMISGKPKAKLESPANGSIDMTEIISSLQALEEALGAAQQIAAEETQARNESEASFKSDIEDLKNSIKSFSFDKQINELRDEMNVIKSQLESPQNFSAPVAVTDSTIKGKMKMVEDHIGDVEIQMTNTGRLMDSIDVRLDETVARIEANEKSIKELFEFNEFLKTKINELDEKPSVIVETKASTEDVEALSNELLKIRETLSNVENRSSEITRQELNALRERLIAIAESSESTTAEVEEIKQYINEGLKNIENIEKIQDQITELAKQSNEATEELKKKIDDITPQRKESDDVVQLEALAKVLKTIDNDRVEQMKSQVHDFVEKSGEIDELKRQVHALDAGLSNMSASIVKLQMDLKPQIEYESMKGNLGESSEMLKQITAKINTILAATDTQSKEIHEIEEVVDDLSTLRNQILDISDRCNRYEDEIKAVSSQHEQFKAQVALNKILTDPQSFTASNKTEEIVSVIMVIRNMLAEANAKIEKLNQRSGVSQDKYSIIEQRLARLEEVNNIETSIAFVPSFGSENDSQSWASAHNSSQFESRIKKIEDNLVHINDTLGFYNRRLGAEEVERTANVTAIQNHSKEIDEQIKMITEKLNEMDELYDSVIKRLKDCEGAIKVTFKKTNSNHSTVQKDIAAIKNDLKLLKVSITGTNTKIDEEIENLSRRIDISISKLGDLPQLPATEIHNRITKMTESVELVKKKMAQLQAKTVAREFYDEVRLKQTEEVHKLEGSIEELKESIERVEQIAQRNKRTLVDIRTQPRIPLNTPPSAAAAAPVPDAETVRKLSLLEQTAVEHDRRISALSLTVSKMGETKERIDRLSRQIQRLEKAMS